jgi:hypothetical protein
LAGAVFNEFARVTICAVTAGISSIFHLQDEFVIRGCTGDFDADFDCLAQRSRVVVRAN